MDFRLPPLASRFVYSLPAIIWACFIFALSATPDLHLGQGSSDFIVRKIAHILIYMVLACLVYIAIQRSWKPAWHLQTAAKAVSICLLYAIVDEAHQSTVPSRNGNPVDIFIDGLGISLGMVVIYWFSWWRRLIQNPWTPDTLTKGSKFVSLEQMPTFSQALAQQLKPGSVVALHGDLGAGKTTLTTYLAKALGITKQLSSPTYTITKQYKQPNGWLLYHYDWYRLQASDVEQLGLEEVIDRADGIIIIEWPERAPHLLPTHTLHLHLDYVDQRTRKITINR